MPDKVMTNETRERLLKCAKDAADTFKDTSRALRLMGRHEMMAQALDYAENATWETIKDVEAALAPAPEPLRSQGESMSNRLMCVPSNDPMKVAWDKWCETDEFKNALEWAVRTKYDDGRPITDINREQHAKGSMWLAFTRKWLDDADQAQQPTAAPATAPRHDPTEADLADPVFNAIWGVIKTWDVSTENNGLYSGATGTDVMMILDAIRAATAPQQEG